MVDNPNLAASLGYAKGFDAYRETWEEAALPSEMDRTRAITEAGIKFLREARPDQPFLLWLHYVNPHAPYPPPPPFDTAFLDQAAAAGPHLKVVKDYHGGIPHQWAVPGQDRLGYYVAQYDGEIATVDQEVGKVVDALRASTVRDHTLLVVTSDHGESLGEHDYFFDHGEDLFDPSLRIPLLVRLPAAPPGQRSEVLASTLDIVPTILDAVKVSYPPDLSGESLLPAGPRSAATLRPERPQLERDLGPAFQSRGHALRRRQPLRALRPRGRSRRDPRPRGLAARRAQGAAARAGAAAGAFGPGVDADAGAPGGEAGAAPPEPRDVREAARDRLRSGGLPFVRISVGERG